MSDYTTEQKMDRTAKTFSARDAGSGIIDAWETWQDTNDMKEAALKYLNVIAHTQMRILRILETK